MPADPTEFLTDGADVQWNTGTGPQGVPFVVIQGEGPTWAAHCTAFEPSDLQARQAMVPGTEIQRLIVYDHPHMTMPILTLDPDPQFQRFVNEMLAKGSWLLMLQYKLDGMPHTRMWISFLNPKETILIKGEGTNEDGGKPIWIVPF